MLRTNSKAAKENIRNYILRGFTPEGYDEYANLEGSNDFPAVAKAIIDCCKREMRAKGFYQLVFTDWCQGLPSILDCCYYCNRSAVDDVAALLEETEEEASRYSETEAENLLTWLIYREIYRYA